MLRLQQLVNTASERPGNNDSFFRWFAGILAGLDQLTGELRAETTKFKSLDAQLDGRLSTLEEWKEQFDVMVNVMSRWALGQQRILTMDRVERFIAEEEALIAAGAA